MKQNKKIALMLSMAIALGTVSATYANDVNDKISILKENNLR